MEKVTAYKCDFCKDDAQRLFLSRSGCAKHEKRCWLNPARKSCATCGNLSEKIEEVEPCGYCWICLVRKNFTPFKSKISNCPHWNDSGGIFINEETLFNRPIERKVKSNLKRLTL